jgi:hypothetical protein
MALCVLSHITEVHESDEDKEDTSRLCELRRMLEFSNTVDWRPNTSYKNKIGQRKVSLST